IAQLGSLGELDDVEFVGQLAGRIVREILPEAMYRLNVLIPLSLVPYVTAAAERCEREGTASAALSAAQLLTELPEKSEEWTEPDWSLWDASEPTRRATARTARLAARASLRAAEASEAVAEASSDDAELAAIDSSKTAAEAIQAAADSASEAASAHVLPVYE